MSNDGMGISYQINSSPTTEKLGGDVHMYLPSQKGNADATFNGVRGNPTIQFDASIGANPNVLINLTAADAIPSDTVFFENSNTKVQEIVLTNDLLESVCKSIKEPGNPINPVFALYDDAYWIHDPRFVSIAFISTRTLAFKHGLLTQNPISSQENFVKHS
jgi:hypothetical protein